MLAETHALLAEPSRDTKRKILIALSTLLGSIVALHIIVQLVMNGHLPDPKRDIIIYPPMLVIQFGAAAYNTFRLRQQAGGTTRWDSVTARG